jgi:hypothetical protein
VRKVVLAVFLFWAGAVAAAAPPAPFWGFALDGHPLSAERLAEVEQETDLPPQIVVFFLQWPAEPSWQDGLFPVATLEAIWQRGAVPCLTWEPMYREGEREVMVPGWQIMAGRYDGYLRGFAREARKWGRPLLVRFGHEMNLDRYHWGTDRASYGPKSPELYKGMFRRVVDLFRQEGATNVLWVFCPNAESVPNESHDPAFAWNRAAAYYPGDGYVDLLGMDGYNWGASRTKERHGWQSRWQSFADIFGPLYKELRVLAPARPIIVFETASVKEGGDRDRWIEEALETAKKWRLAGIVWFHVNKDEDWRLRKGEKAVTAVRQGFSSSQNWLRGFLR